MQFSDFDWMVLQPEDGFINEKVRPIDRRLPKVNPFWQFSTQQLVYPCGTGAVVDDYHSWRLIGRCGSWRCNACGPLNKSIFLSKCQWVRERHDGLVIFSVLTFRSKDGEVIGRSGRPLSLASQKVQVRRWISLAGELLGTKAYCKVPEPHKSGVAHWNIIWFGGRRDFTSCPIINSKRKADMRLACNVCIACNLRSIWTKLSGAERSTHTHAGEVARYVSKYLTKDWANSFYAKNKRFFFSRACKTPPRIVPAYHWVYREALKRDNGILDTPFEYIFGEETKYNVDGADRQYFEGCRLERTSCSEKHRGLCDKVPMWSDSQIAAYGGIDKVWEDFGRVFGKDTEFMVRDKIARLIAWRL